jgi:hypothetical protein
VARAADERLPLDPDAQLQQDLEKNGTATTEVSTDPRVFERITLGLYREPASAIRELISNAYDADAKEVIVKTNPPLFNEIGVYDDGIGMTAETIRHLVHHVGGSLKRSNDGVRAGVTKSSGMSPGGRRLIGQMGIGIYSVARLTRHFKIETKRQGDKQRFVVEIDLTGLDPANLPEEGAQRYVAGYAKVTRERVHPAEVERSYTRITLKDVLNEARQILQSVDRWENFVSKASHRKKGELKYHIGRVGTATEANLPWQKTDSPEKKFKSFVDALSTSAEASESSASIDQTLDYYLSMLWRISLSAPLGYVERHPFSLTSKDEVDFYTLSASDATPELVQLEEGETIGKRLGVSEVGASPSKFKVVIDGVELRRPIVFRPFEANDRRLLNRPKMFIGQYASVADGANLRLTGYLFWSYEIVPKENNGMLVRISGASGTLFDRTFLGYRTSENLRLRQVSSEVFVDHGLDNALNIDRESFVDSDPNVRALQRWAHRSMTRLFSRLKADQKEVAEARKHQEQEREAQRVQDAAEKVWKRLRGRRAKPQVVVSSRSAAPPKLPKDTIFIGGIPSERRGGVEKEVVYSARLRAIVLVLEAYGVLDELGGPERSQLIKELSSVINRD